MIVTDRDHIIRNALALSLTTLAAALGPMGCSGSGSTSSRGHATAVTPADFADPSRPTVTSPDVQAAVMHPTATDTSHSRVEYTGPVAATDGILDVQAEIGRPSLAASDAGPVENPKFVQSKVGDINGRAIYAMNFLAPMEARFRAEAKKLKPGEWLTFIDEEIRRQLEQDIQDELLMAEARESFSAEQKQGFLAFLEQVRDNLYSANRGSRAAANRKLYETQGKSEEEWLREREQTELVQFQLSQAINKKTVVTWREIQQWYDRDYEKWNPPPVAYLHVIRVPTAKKDRVDAVQKALEGGEDFVALASGPDNVFKRAEAGLQEQEFKGDYATATLFGVETLNTAAHSLQPGQWAGPVQWGDATAWVYLARIEKVNRSLYEVQLWIEDQLREGKGAANRSKYLQRIKARSSITNVDEMTKRLADISIERFNPAAAGVKPLPLPQNPNAAPTIGPARRR